MSSPSDDDDGGDTAAASSVVPALLTIDVVTGATQGIGRAIAETIARYRSEEQRRQKKDRNGDSAGGRPYKLVLVGRNETRGQEVAESIRKEHEGQLAVVFASCELSDYRQVLALKEKLTATAAAALRVGVLVNNAAECPRRQQFVRLPRRGESEPVPVDRQFASNVLSYHFVLSAFEECLFGNSRVVAVASNWAGDLDLTDLNFRRRPYDNDAAYRQSKQCDRMLAAVWADRLQGRAVVNSCHPGDPRTTLSVSLGYNTTAPPPSEDSIRNETAIPFLCGFGDDGELSKKVTMSSGGWYDGVGNRPSRCRFSGMDREAEELFAVCESYRV